MKGAFACWGVLTGWGTNLQHDRKDSGLDQGAGPGSCVSGL